VDPILNQSPAPHQGDPGRLWLIAGTGEGLPLAIALQRQGWRLRVSVVSPEAARPYRSTAPAGAVLELQVGALAGVVAMQGELQQAHRRGDPFAVVVDASHPFATRVSGDLAVACQREVVPLWRLQRSCLPIGKAELLPNLNALAQLSLDGVPLLLALGARHLGRAVAASPGAIHHARVLPNVQALQLALAARLESARLACLRPGGDFAIEEALVRRWGIRAVLCRQSGGLTETGWRGIAESMGLRLLLLARPAEPDPGRCLGMEDLLRTLQAVRGALIP